MSTENHNGSTPHANGSIKSAIGGSLTSSVPITASITTARTTSNNTSFLYSSNSTLNREKSRQAPPPTLPKYTSSFNAGTNGNTDRLVRDRETGSSYRLASLDRLALRQRILDSEKANGEIANSMQTKRELFFKGDSGLTTSPSVPSVPPPQPPANVMSTTGASITTSTTTTSAITTTTMTTAITTSVSSSVVPPIASVKPRLPQNSVNSNQSDHLEDSNKRESIRNDSNKESALQIHLRPAVQPTKPKELDGYVGFANLPNQVYRKAVKKGFEFTLMVVGESGLGKSTLINSMFLADIYSAEYPGPSLRVKKTVAVETSKVLLKENGVNLTLTVVDTPGFGDAVDNSNCWVPVIEFIESKYEEFLNAESRIVRKQIPDSRVHCCLYFISPSGHGLKPLDVEFMQRLHDKVNIIPIIAKADTMTPEECTHFKKQVLNEIAQHKIKIYEFPELEEEEENKLHKILRDRVPFAVVGANTVIEHDGKKIRGRKYPWGVAEVENLEHCDFIALRNMVIRTHLQDLKDVTNNVHYENFRCRTLAGLGVDGKPTRVTNNLCPPGVMNSFMTVWNPLAQLEEEKREHDTKMKKMEMEMEQVFEMKVREKKQKLKDSETDLQRRHEQMRRSLEQQLREVEEKRRAFEADKQAWEQQTGQSIEELRRRSLDANSKETGSVSSEGSGGGGGTLRGSRGFGSLLRRHTSFKSPQDSPTQIQLVIQHPEHP
ncbi:septin-7 isoform X1 [Chelonus insularis]|uniref:septin-7 isoform X1 n=2 Tax=Chelonus insularis TaxID=460826 RepID=UPI001588DFF5|nr:septin-7 isoform X1 [Chelonus insularis]XP_034942975.1 septin-7 isoform X1 [Chelonus insularis]XP_034942976.1 septin-7 isoform X1 [Chelonus insularis]